MAYNTHARQTDSHVAQFYDMIIEKVVEDLTPRLEEEGIDTSVLHSIKQLWKEKLHTSYDVHMPGFAGAGDFRGGGMQMRAAPSHLDYGLGLYPNPGSSGDGLAIPRPHHALPHGADIFMHNVRLQQSDGCVNEESHPPVSQGSIAFDQLPFRCPAAAANRRMPRKGDEVFFALSFDEDDDTATDVSCSGTSALEQMDGLGSGPKRRKTGEESYEEEGGDVGDDDDEDVAGVGGNEDEDLNSDDDDDDDAEIERTTEHVILCRYDKVTRQKQKWKAQFRDGMMRAKGRDFLFRKANGDMNFQK